MPMALCCCSVDEDDLIIEEKEAYLRHLESLGLVRSPQPMHMDVGAVPEVIVTLNVYSLLSGSSERRLNALGVGVFHCGVVVYGIEWGYGEALDQCQVTGLFCVHPGEAAGALYRSIVLGSTTKSPMQVDTILRRMENEWLSDDYHILHHNCNNFAQTFLDFLSTKEKLLLPRWCNRAARMGDRVVPQRFATYIQRLIEEEPPKAKQPPRDTRVGELRASVIPRYWYLNPRIAQPLRYVIPDTNTQSQHFSTTLVVPPPGAGANSRNGSVARPGAMLRRSSAADRVHNDDDDINGGRRAHSSADSNSLSDGDLSLYSPLNADHEEYIHSRSRKRPRLSELQRENTMRPTPIATPLVKIESESAFGNAAAATEGGRSGSCASVNANSPAAYPSHSKQQPQKPSIVMIPQPPQLKIPVSPRRQDRATAKLLLTPIVVENNFTLGGNEAASPMAQFTPSTSTPMVAQPSILTPRMTPKHTAENQQTPKIAQFGKPRRRALSLDGALRPPIDGVGAAGRVNGTGGEGGRPMRYSQSVSGLSAQMPIDFGEESAFIRNTSSQYFQDVDSFELIPNMRRPRHLQSVAPSEDDENGEGSGVDDEGRKRKASKKKSVSESSKKGFFGSKGKSSDKNKKDSNKNKKKDKSSGAATPKNQRRHFHRCRRHEKEHADQILNSSSGKATARSERQGKAGGSQRGGKGGRSTSKEHTTTTAETPRRGIGSLLRSFASSFIASRSPSSSGDDVRASHPGSAHSSSCSCCTCSYDYSYSCTSTPSFASTFIDFEHNSLNPSLKDERGSSVDVNACSCSCPTIALDAILKPHEAGATPNLPPLPLPVPPVRLPSRAQTRASSVERQTSTNFAVFTPLLSSGERRHTAPLREKLPAAAAVPITAAEESEPKTEATSKPETLLDKMSLWRKAKAGVLGDSKPNSTATTPRDHKVPELHSANDDKAPQHVKMNTDADRAAVKDKNQKHNDEDDDKKKKNKHNHKSSSRTSSDEDVGKCNSDDDDEDEDVHHGNEDSVFYRGDKMVRVQASTEASVSPEEMNQYADGLVSGKREPSKGGKPGVRTKLLENLLSKVGPSSSTSSMTQCEITENSPTTGVTSAVRDMYAEKSSPVRVNQASRIEGKAACEETTAFPHALPHAGRSDSIDSGLLNTDANAAQVSIPDTQITSKSGEKKDSSEVTGMSSSAHTPKDKTTAPTSARAVDVPKWRSMVRIEGGSSTPSGDGVSQRKAVVHREGCRHYHPTLQHVVPGTGGTSTAVPSTIAVNIGDLRGGLSSIAAALPGADGGSVKEPKRRHHRHIHRRSKVDSDTCNGGHRRKPTTGGGGASTPALGSPDGRSSAVNSVNGVTPLGKPPSHPPTRNISTLLRTPNERRQSTPLVGTRCSTPPLAPRRMSTGNSPILSLTTTQVFNLPVPSMIDHSDGQAAAPTSEQDSVRSGQSAPPSAIDGSTTSAALISAAPQSEAIAPSTTPSKDTPASKVVEVETGPSAVSREETRLPAQADVSPDPSAERKGNVRVVLPQRRVSNLSHSSLSSVPTPYQSRSSPISREEQHHGNEASEKPSSSSNNLEKANDAAKTNGDVSNSQPQTAGSGGNSSRRRRHSSEMATEDMSFSNNEVVGATSADARNREEDDEYDDEPLTQAAKVHQAHPRLRGGNGDRSNATDFSMDLDALSVPTSTRGPDHDPSRMSADLAVYGSTSPTEPSITTAVVSRHAIGEQVQAGRQIAHWGLQAAADDDMPDSTSSDEEGGETEPASLNGYVNRGDATVGQRTDTHGLEAQGSIPNAHTGADFASTTSVNTNEQQTVDVLPTSPLLTQRSEDAHEAGDASAGTGTFDESLFSQEEEGERRQERDRGSESYGKENSEDRVSPSPMIPAPIHTQRGITVDTQSAMAPGNKDEKLGASTKQSSRSSSNNSSSSNSSTVSSKAGKDAKRKDDGTGSNASSSSASSSSKRGNFATKPLFAQFNETQNVPNTVERRKRHSLDALAKTATEAVGMRDHRLEPPTSSHPHHPSPRNHHRTNSADALKRSAGKFDETPSASMPIGIQTSRNGSAAMRNKEVTTEKTPVSEGNKLGWKKPEEEEAKFLTLVKQSNAGRKGDNPLQGAGREGGGGGGAIPRTGPSISGTFMESMSGDDRFYNAAENIGRSAHVVSAVASSVPSESPTSVPSGDSQLSHNHTPQSGSPQSLDPRPFNVSHARSLSLSASLPNGIQLTHPNEVLPEDSAGGGGGGDGPESHSLNSTNHGLNELRKLSGSSSMKESKNE